MAERDHASPAVVFVPGFMQGAASWSPVRERLPARYRGVALDHRADDLEGRVREIEAAAPPGAALVGYSLGGRLALHVALRAAGRPGRYRALVTLGASAGIEDGGERERRRAADLDLAAWIEGQPIEAVVRRWERQPVLADQPEELVAAQRPDRLRHEPARLAALLRSAGQGAFGPLWDRLPGLPVPILAVAGERDPKYVALAERLAELVPRGRAAAIAEAGHAAHLERPGAFACVLVDFLDEHLGERRLVDGDA